MLLIVLSRSWMDIRNILSLHGIKIKTFFKAIQTPNNRKANLSLSTVWTVSTVIRPQHDINDNKSWIIIES